MNKRLQSVSSFPVSRDLFLLEGAVVVVVVVVEVEVEDVSVVLLSLLLFPAVSTGGATVCFGE